LFFYFLFLSTNIWFVFNLIFYSHVTIFRDFLTLKGSRVSCSGWINFVLQIADLWPDIERLVDNRLEENRDLASIEI
jgi:hypothetical protein